MKNAKSKIQNWLLSICILNFAFLVSSCGVPKLESPECGEARAATKRFYSMLFANREQTRPEKNLQNREQYLTKELIADVGNSSDSIAFTASSEFPDTFKIGACEVTGTNRAILQIQLYFRNDSATSQREVHVETVKDNDRWLINKVITNY